jgi:release factor glutamine methyltransferase
LTEHGEKKVFFEEAAFTVFGGVYEPAEDTFLAAENLAVNVGDEVLEVGSGCGILAVLSAKRARRVVAVDVNPDAAKCTRLNAKANGVSGKVDVVRGDMLGPLGGEARFDVVLFNAPYLPTEDEEPRGWVDRAWQGGRGGRELIDRFVAQAPEHLKRGGHILLVQSTLSDVRKTLESFAEKNLEAKVVAERKAEFETITVIRAKKLP